MLSSLEQLASELHLAILQFLSKGDRSALRLASQRTRLLLNKYVKVLKIASEDVNDTVDLHTRFPSISELTISGELLETKFLDFVLGQLTHLKELHGLDISTCCTLGSGAVLAIVHSCTQLRALLLPGGTHWRSVRVRSVCWHRRA